MSNIFEIDGELEDNDDEKGQEQSSKTQDSENENDEDLGAVIMEDDDNEGDDEIPWYDKVLAEDDSDSDGTEEMDEATKAEFDNDDEIDSIPEIPEIDDVEIDDETSPEPKAKVDPNDPFTSGLKKASTADVDSETSSDKLTDEEKMDALDESNSEDVEIAEDAEAEAAVAQALAAAEMNEDEDPSPKTHGKKPKKEPPKVNETEEKKEEGFDQIFPRKEKSGGIAIGTIVFGLLFLIVLGLLSYYQFYDGHGFNMSFQHKSVAQDGEHSMSSSSHDLDAATEKLRMDKEELEGKVRKLEAEINKLKAGGASLATTSEGRSPRINPNQGTVYQIQVTALKEYNPNFSNSSFELFVDEEDGFAKFLIGAFSSESEVKAFEKKLQKAGFDDTFIVKKINGERVEYEP